MPIICANIVSLSISMEDIYLIDDRFAQRLNIQSQRSSVEDQMKVSGK